MESCGAVPLWIGFAEKDLMATAKPRKADGTREDLKGRQTAAHLDKGEQAIWQRRYWEHKIRDDVDFIRHIEYIHYNPVKHGLTKSPKLWPHSTFHRYLNQGIYHEDWGEDNEIAFEYHIGNE